jgi:hypothetical protein
MSTRNRKKCFWGVSVRLTSLLSVSQLSRHWGILNISQFYRPPQPVTGIDLLFNISSLLSNDMCLKFILLQMEIHFQKWLTSIAEHTSCSFKQPHSGNFRLTYLWGYIMLWANNLTEEKSCVQQDLKYENYFSHCMMKMETSNFLMMTKQFMSQSQKDTPPQMIQTQFYELPSKEEKVWQLRPAEGNCQRWKQWHEFQTTLTTATAVIKLVSVNE